MKKSSILSTIAILYFMVGLVIAILFALYYKWPVYSFLSPAFYSVIFTWPYQLIGFINNFLLYGWMGKPI